MELWDQEAMDLVEPAFIEFGEDETGDFGFIAVRGAWIAVMRLATAAPAWSSRGRATTTATGPAAGAGQR
jgi:hypothetical protein